MSEEKAFYATAEGKMRAALAVARVDILSSSIPNALSLVQQIDDALAMGIDNMELEDMKQFIIMQSGGHIRQQLFELPGKIKDQSLTVAALVNQTEALRLSHANSKNQALELVLSTTEDGKAKYSNDKARNMAVEQMLREDKMYLDTVDGLSRKECEMRREQIQLDHLHNQFRAYLAVAGMQGVRS